MPYTSIAMCLMGVLFYFNAGKLEARDGSADHSLVWASLSLLTSVVVLWLGAWLDSVAGRPSSPAHCHRRVPSSLRGRRAVSPHSGELHV
jgi:hypothetical protein